MSLGAGSPSVLMTGPQASWGPSRGATSLVSLPSDALYWPEGVTAADPLRLRRPQGTQDWGLSGRAATMAGLDLLILPTCPDLEPAVRPCSPACAHHQERGWLSGCGIGSPRVSAAPIITDFSVAFLSAFMFSFLC